MSKIILFSNIKGGVGKTTLCAHFAEYLSMKGVPVVAGCRYSGIFVQTS